ncbi:MAG: M15 family metallopeptidase [Clostridiales bacterium]|jgi:D-alanyl-D-alanine carboxypeptidase|nr:M15 family metallopeptidase [Clostridiales bacterium]
MKKAIFIFACVLLLFVGAYLISNAGDGEIPLSSEMPPTVANKIQTKLTRAEFQVLHYEELLLLCNEQLLLVNNEHAVPSNASGNFANVADYVSASEAFDVSTMDENALVALRTMFTSAANAGFDEFYVTQGFRTQERQYELYANAADASFVARPGHSEHQTGLAADISYRGANIANSQQGTWLANNAHLYGFILRYPAHKTEITGFPAEPWHFRYVGQPHANYMHQNDLALEEYIEHLKSRGEITAAFAGIVYEIYYFNPGDSIELPHNNSFTSSRDNTGGIIVTVSQ